MPSSKRRAIGISIHTGWAACVVVEGSRRDPKIFGNEEIEMLGDAEPFCYHMAEGMKLEEAKRWIASCRKKALVNAKRALRPLTEQCRICALVAKDRDPGTLEQVLASHPRIHTAEGCFYRDVLRDACDCPVEIVPPSRLDPSTLNSLGKLAGPPWGRDQKLAALAAWEVLR